MPLAMTLVLAVVTMVAVVIVVAAIAVFMMVAVTLVLGTIAGRIDVVVPTVLHEVDLLAASVVLTAVLGPFFHMAGRYAQINRPSDMARRLLNDDRFSIDHGRLGKTANVNPAVKARLADIDRHADIGRH